MDLVKLAVRAVFLITVAGPVALCLSQYGWQVAPLITPQYTPPRVDLSVKYEGLDVLDEEVTVTFLVENKGEVPLTLRGVDAKLYDLSGIELECVHLANPLHLEPGEVDRLNLTLSLDPLVQKLISHFPERQAIHLTIRGRVFIKVLGTNASASLELGVWFSAEQLGLTPERVLVSVKEAVRVGDSIEFVLCVLNPTRWKVIVEAANAKLYGPDGAEICPLILKGATAVEPGSEAVLVLIARLDRPVEAKLAEYLLEGETVFMIKGSMETSTLGLRRAVPVEVNITVTRNLFGE